MVKGETPSLILKERLENSLVCIKEHPEIKIIVSGGRGLGENISEAEAMKIYLIKHGVNDNRIIMESNSINTMENLKFTKDKIKQVDNRKKIKIIIVTNDFHMFRAKFLAKRNGFKPLGYSVNTKVELKPAFYVREYFAVIKSLIFDKER